MDLTGHLVNALLLSHILNHAIKSAFQIVICLDGYGMSCMNVIVMKLIHLGGQIQWIGETFCIMQSLVRIGIPHDD